MPTNAVIIITSFLLLFIVESILRSVIRRLPNQAPPPNLLALQSRHRAPRPKVLTALQPFCISDKILLAMICISITRRDLALLKYCFTLTDPDAVFWAATTSLVLISATAMPDPIIWDVLLDNGWSRPSGQHWEAASTGLTIQTLPGGQTHQEWLSSLALIAMKDARRIDLLNVLCFRRFCDMRSLLENYDGEEGEVNGSKALLVAAGSNQRISRLYSISGLIIDWKALSPSSDRDNEKIKEKDTHKETDRKQLHSHHDKKRGGEKKTLHVAAAMGNLDAFKMLSKHGARTDIKDSHGRTAERTALENGGVEIAELLKVIDFSRS
ncbi:uncharacterized protein PAC_00844 [Phialocephala subalpina]|uniref:Uncharacterized protein n=1 Tax=Phialocephala subalpina TaxID=576137 RepID=A0A1L7WE18_9HELO|nr:uncharacterized protein PAC_00844 [Phialocephala subalpina]